MVAYLRDWTTSPALMNPSPFVPRGAESALWASLNAGLGVSRVVANRRVWITSVESTAPLPAKRGAMSPSKPGVGVAVGVPVGVAVGVLVGVLVGVAVGVFVGVAVGVAVGVGVGFPASQLGNLKDPTMVPQEEFDVDA